MTIWFATSLLSMLSAAINSSAKFYQSIIDSSLAEISKAQIRSALYWRFRIFLLSFLTLILVCTSFVTTNLKGFYFPNKIIPPCWNPSFYAISIRIPTMLLWKVHFCTSPFPLFIPLHIILSLRQPSFLLLLQLLCLHLKCHFYLSSFYFIPSEYE